jgi:hypothetical protein
MSIIKPPLFLLIFHDGISIFLGIYTITMSIYRFNIVHALILKIGFIGKCTVPVAGPGCSRTTFR